MKVRNGFVSNSSSSSFVIALPRVPESAEDLRTMLFDEKDEFFPHPYENGESYPISQVCETLFGIIGRRSASLKKMTEAVACGWFEGYPNIDDYRKPTEKGEIPDINWEAYQKEQNARARKIAKDFRESNKGCVFFTLSLGDDDGSYFGALEHGDTFEKVPHLAISCH